MSPETASAIATSLPASWSANGPLEIIWHAGEPLASGRAGFVRMLDEFEPMRREGLIKHKVQTGATLVSERWCDVFEQYDVGVGISIDGPRTANGSRVDRHGRAMFDRIVSGVDVLRRRGIPFTALAVVTPTTVNRASEVLDFIASLGCTWIGLNIEALEAANAQDGTTPPVEDARAFWRETFTWALNHQDVHVRDFERLLTFLGLAPAERARPIEHDLIPTIGANGDVVVLSPELLGVRDAEHDDFVVGNVNSTPLPRILENALSAQYVTDYREGLAKCQQECEFFAYCQGAHAGNRYFEHGTFTATETEHCRSSYQAPALALADLNGTRRHT